MTNTEAITKLTNIMHDDHYAWHPSIQTAFNMAVDALRGAEGDCISRADVNRVLEDWFKVVIGVDSFRKTGLCRELRELPSAQPEQRWIPVTERLPEKECFALVTVNDGAIYTDLSLFRKDGRFIEHTGDVIAWMPLPEPYREDKE